MNPQKRIKEKITKAARGMAIFRATVKDGKGGQSTGSEFDEDKRIDDTP